jgi:RNA polymerase sigma-70 factor (ECF subfamily)
MDSTAPANPSTEADLVRWAARGDANAFRALTDRYYRPVCGFVFKRVRRTDLVEDLAQETFLEAFRSLKVGRLPEHFSSWLFGIAHNCCGKWLRRKRPVLFSPHDAPEVEAPPSEFDALQELEEQQRRLAALENKLAELPDETRWLLDLKHRQGKTCEQIAVETGRPVGTIKSLLARTYKMLRARLGSSGEDGP